MEESGMAHGVLFLNSNAMGTFLSFLKMEVATIYNFIQNNLYFRCDIAAYTGYNI